MYENRKMDLASPRMPTARRHCAKIRTDDRTNSLSSKPGICLTVARPTGSAIRSLVNHGRPTDLVPAGARNVRLARASRLPRATDRTDSAPPTTCDGASRSPIRRPGTGLGDLAESVQRSLDSLPCAQERSGESTRRPILESQWPGVIDEARSGVRPGIRSTPSLPARISMADRESRPESAGDRPRANRFLTGGRMSTERVSFPGRAGKPYGALMDPTGSRPRPVEPHTGLRFGW